MKFYHFKFFSTIIENKNKNVKDENCIEKMLNKVEKAFPL